MASPAIERPKSSISRNVMAIIPCCRGKLFRLSVRASGLVAIFFFYMNGIGFHPYFGYGNAVRVKLHSNDFICALANGAREYGKFCKRFIYRQFLITNRIN
jgi:hypothetical protein